LLFGILHRRAHSLLAACQIAAKSRKIQYWVEDETRSAEFPGQAMAPRPKGRSEANRKGTLSRPASTHARTIGQNLPIPELPAGKCKAAFTPFVGDAENLETLLQISGRPLRMSIFEAAICLRKAKESSPVDSQEIRRLMWRATIWTWPRVSDYLRVCCGWLKRLLILTF
jgi:hypothetical protein